MMRRKEYSLEEVLQLVSNEEVQFLVRLYASEGKKFVGERPDVISVDDLSVYDILLTTNRLIDKQIADLRVQVAGLAAAINKADAGGSE